MIRDMSTMRGQLAGDSANQIASELSYYIEKVMPSNDSARDLQTVLVVKTPKNSVLVTYMLRDLYGIESRIDSKSFYPTETVVFDNDQIID